MTQETKAIIMARHGLLDNPRNIVYNRDDVMDPNDIIHLSEQGKEQMARLAAEIKARGIEVTKVWSSPSIRAQESSAELIKGLKLDDFEVVDNLDDLYAPGPYKLGMNMDKLQEIDGNVYGTEWAEYNMHRRRRQISPAC